MANTPEVERKHPVKSRKRSSSWSCRWLPFSCGDNDELEPASPISRSLTDDLFWDQPPANVAQNCSGSSGTHSATMSGSLTSGATVSTLHCTASLNSVLEVDGACILGSEPRTLKHPATVTASRCDGPRCFNCGSASVHMTGADLPDGQSHPLMPDIQHESFCNKDCIWTYIFSRQGKTTIPGVQPKK